MKLRNYITVLTVRILALGPLGLPASFAQEPLMSSSLSTPSSDEKLHALTLTRFHFITLKQFHSALFSQGVDQNFISNSEAEMLNTALNAFLTSAGRETTLLEALRQNKAIKLRFSILEEENTYEIETHPTKPLLYHLEPVTRRIPVVIEIRPLLDSPMAFQITLENGNEHCLYNVDWAGKIDRASREHLSNAESRLASLQQASRAIDTSV